MAVAARASRAPSPRAARGEGGSSSRRLPGWLSVVAVLIAGLFVVPLAFMLVGSLKPDARVLSEGDSWRALLPTGATLQNYADAFERGRFGRLFLNSAVITSSIVVGSLLVNSLFGYALARLPFRGRTLLLGLVIALIIIPFQAIAIPLLFMMSQLRQLDTYQVQILPFVANPLFIYLFYTFFLSIPRELEEAARVDGAGPVTIFVKVVAPLAKPAFATVAILAFLFSWGELLWPVLVTRGPEVRPLPLGIAEFQNLPPIEWGDILAFAAMVTAPLLVVFLAFQRAFVQSVARSGVKG